MARCEQECCRPDLQGTVTCCKLRCHHAQAGSILWILQAYGIESLEGFVVPATLIRIGEKAQGACNTNAIALTVMRFCTGGAVTQKCIGECVASSGKQEHLEVALGRARKLRRRLTCQQRKV